MKQLLAALSLSLAFAWFGAVSLAQSTGTLTISPSSITLQESDTPTNSVQSFEIQLSPVPTATVTLDWQTDFECEVAVMVVKSRSSNQLSFRLKFILLQYK